MTTAITARCPRPPSTTTQDAASTAQNTFIFGQEYGVGEAMANRAVVVTTTLSLATLSTAAALLG